MISSRSETLISPSSNGLSSSSASRFGASDVDDDDLSPVSTESSDSSEVISAFLFFCKTKRRNRQLKEKEIEEEEETVGGWAWISFQGRGDAEGDKELKSPHTFLHVWKVCHTCGILAKRVGSLSCALG